MNKIPKTSGKRRKRIKILSGVLLLLLLTLLTVSVRITEVTVTGNEQYTDQQVIDLLFPGKYDRNTGYCFLKDRFRPHIQIPFVEDYRIEVNGLNQVDIIVYEKNVVGYVSYMSSYMYFDKDGIIVESANSRVDGIPWVTGLEYGQIVLFQPLPIENKEIFGDILNITQFLSINEIQVDKIQYSRNREVVLYIDNLEIVLGGSEGIGGKIAELKGMLPELSGQAGTLFLDTFREAGDNDLFIFKPINPP